VKEENVEAMDVFERIEKGFPDFMHACVNGTEFAESGTPHPFDSHPPLVRRLESLGLDSQSVLKSQNTIPALEDSWFSAIEGAAAIEAEQWKAFEESFHQAHQRSLAWRFKPEGEAEIRHVAKYFPEIQFRGTKGLIATMDYEKLLLSGWDSPLFFSAITHCRLEQSLGRHNLVIEYKLEGQNKKQISKVRFKEFKREGANFLESFQHYYGRHLSMKKYHAQRLRPAQQ